MTKRITALLLVGLMIVGMIGCGRMTKKVDAGACIVDMPGEPTKSTQQLPLNLLGIGLDGALTVTALESLDKDGAEYVVLSVGWGDTLTQMAQIKGDLWDTDKFAAAVIDNLVELLLEDAQMQEESNVTVSGKPAHIVAFTITEELEFGQKRVTKGEYVAFVDPNSLVMAVYAAEDNVYSERDKNNFLYSITLSD